MKRKFALMLLILIPLVVPAKVFAYADWHYNGAKSNRLPSKGIINPYYMNDPRGKLSRKFSCFDLNRDGIIVPAERDKVFSKRPNRCTDPQKYKFKSNQ